MLCYSEFKKVVIDKILHYLGDDYKGYNVKVTEFKKNNTKLDCLNVLPDSDGPVMAPNIYLEDVYEEYKDNDDIELTMMNLANFIRSVTINIFDTMQVKEIAPEKKDIIYAVINKDSNKDLLKDVPYRDFLDLAVVYRCIRQIPGYGTATILITNEIMKKFNLNEDELFAYAKENTEKKCPNTLENMRDIISGTRICISEDDLTHLDESPIMYVASNNYKSNGANAILNKELLRKCSEKFNNDFYILPSSIHEIIMVADLGQEVEGFKDMVKEVNDNAVELVDRLSYSVYKYNRDASQVVMAN